MPIRTKPVCLPIILIALLFVMGMLNALNEPGWGSAFPSRETRYRASPFGGEALIQRATKNAEDFNYARQIQNSIIRDAQPWMKLSDDQLWGLMFGPKVLRSHFVKPYGGCPECGMEMIRYNKKHPSYPALYAWLYDPWERPFKLWCPNPNCGAEFPKNDFGKYYQSGIGQDGLFDPERADKKFLYNVEHPDPKDPNHTYGVDDGGLHGWKDWRFIAYYFRVARWKEQVLGGIDKLSLAYVATGNPEYAHKAAILLDRVADVYPEMDYLKQGTVYHIESSAKGYVEYSIDAAKNVTTMARAYGRIVGAIENDQSLLRFLSSKAAKGDVVNRKSTIDEVRENIETNIFQNACNRLDKLESNPPQRELMQVYCDIVRNWPHNRNQILRDVAKILRQWTQCDGLTGQKGLQEYAASGMVHIGRLLYLLDQLDPRMLQEVLQRVPDLRHTFDFYIDVWCLNLSYPAEGDGGVLGMRASLEGPPDIPGRHYINSTAFSLIPIYCLLYGVLKDDRYAQFVYELNGQSVAGLPGDLFADDPGRTQERIKMVIEQKGQLQPVSTHKSKYHLALLQSGVGETGRALWLDYDAEGGHRHLDGMNFGLFAKGLPLVADLGYPPDMGYGTTITTAWYQLSLSHNLVVVDGVTQKGGTGKLTIFEEVPGFGLIQAEGNALYKQCSRYQRTLALVDVVPGDGYVIDVFRVVGGKEHLKSFHATFGELEHALNLKFCSFKLAEGHLKNLGSLSGPGKRFEIDWKILDKYNYLSPDRQVRLHYTELTDFDEVLIGDGELGPGRTPATIPYVLTKREVKVEQELTSTFVSVIEPYEGKRIVRRVIKLKMSMADGSPCPDGVVGLRIDLNNGMSDYFVATDRQEVARKKRLHTGVPSVEIICEDENLSVETGIQFFRVRDRKVEPIFVTGGGFSYHDQVFSVN